MSLLKTTRGFTLTEIMVVVAIISLLLSIAIPNFIRAKENATVQSCLANIASIEAAKAMWAMDTDAAEDAVPTEDDIAPYLLGGFPKGPTTQCVYIIGDMRTPVRCPVHGSL